MYNLYGLGPVNSENEVCVRVAWERKVEIKWRSSRVPAKTGMFRTSASSAGRTDGADGVAASLVHARLSSGLEALLDCRVPCCAVSRPTPLH